MQFSQKVFVFREIRKIVLQTHIADLLDTKQYLLLYDLNNSKTLIDHTRNTLLLILIILVMMSLSVNLDSTKMISRGGVLPLKMYRGANVSYLGMTKKYGCPKILDSKIWSLHFNYFTRSPA